MAKLTLRQKCSARASKNVTRHKGRSQSHRKKGGMRSTRPNPDTLANLFDRMAIVKPDSVKPVKMTIDKNSIDELSHLFGNLKGHKKHRKSKLGIKKKFNRNKPKTQKNPFVIL